ncbi:MAG: hypothetical protein U0K37_04610 [Acutalibacteraceae bacterium]|nr:hypothetical protein [Acutalibacteraceae bacterium]
MKRILSILLSLLMLLSVACAVPAMAGPIEGVSTKAQSFPGKDGAKKFDKLHRAPVNVELPEHVYLRDSTQSFNRHYEIALADGVLYVKKRNTAGPWKVAPCPEALKGKITGISMDADEIVALDKDNWIYNCFDCNDDTNKWNWGTAWGGVGRQGDSYQIGNSAPGKWALSITNVKQDKTYTDKDGKVHPVSLAGCTQLVFVDPNDPTKIISNDPWLPRDHSYNFGSPYHCRFKVNSLSASASTVFIMNKYGDMYTRQKDYDLSGGDPAQFRYSWLSQGDKVAASNYFEHRLNPTSAAIRLPSPYWQKQPKIPGTITDRISIESTDAGTENRLLKVEGSYKGKNGFWCKMLNDSAWRFYVTNEPLKGNPVQNPKRDTSAEDLAPETGLNYTGTIENAQLTVENFAYEDSVQPATLRIGNTEVPATLYTEYGNLGRAVTQVLTERDDGLSADPRRYVAALELSPDAIATLKTTSEGQAFLDDFMKGRSIRPLSMEATTDTLVLYPASDLNTPNILQSYTLDKTN